MVNVFRANVDNACYRLPSWVMVTTLVSLLLMTINASINFFIYCWINTTFRKELTRRFSSCAFLELICGDGGAGSSASNNNNNLTRRGGGATTAQVNSHSGGQESQLLTRTPVAVANGGAAGAGSPNGGGSSNSITVKTKKAPVSDL